MSSHRYQQPPRPPQGPPTGPPRHGGPTGPHGQMPPQPPRPPQRHKPRFRWYEHPATVGSTVGAVTLLLGVALGIAAAPEPAAASKPAPTVTTTKTEQSTSKPTVTKTKTHKVKVTKTVRKPPKADATIPGDGTYEVGKDVKPGTYRGKPGLMGTCYWARLSDASGDMDSIIANGNIEGPTLVELSDGEYFQTRGCKTWKRQ